MNQPEKDDSAGSGEAAPPKRRRVYPRKSAVVLEAAERTFLEYGFAATSMDDIADAAGVSKRTVYSNFGGKEDLFAEVIRSRCSAVPPGDATIAKAESLDLEAGLRLIAVGFLKNVLARSQVELYQTVVAAARLRPEIGQITALVAAQSVTHSGYTHKVRVTARHPLLGRRGSGVADGGDPA